MKKNILFVMNNLTCGGAEKALISLLETIDYAKFNVDLLLFKQEGLFLSQIPPEVNLLAEPCGYKYFDMSIKTAIKDCIQKGQFDIVFSRLKAGYIFRTEENKAICEQKVWKCLSNILQSIQKEYDVAIGYLEKSPVYFSIEKVNAKKKIGFIHNDYNKLGMDPKIDEYYFSKLDNILTVSEECARVLRSKFPQYKNKVDVMYNIVSPAVLNKLSTEKIDIVKSGVTLVSVGRLTQQKGFELAVKACKNLVKNGYDVKWYVIGEGEERVTLERLIIENDLLENFILLGLKENPYPYIKAADIYVQPSRFEGKSIAIDEAKILNKPIVVTNFSTVTDQISNNQNGLIVEMNPKAIAGGIKRLIDNVSIRNSLKENLLKEELGTESEIQKLYDLFRVGQKGINK
ncbi:glycosyltransferase [Halalkalibacter alkalisediminis]|uniref:Glycosyltransferase n=1 Tax=Halalkalibacter alkalisediminis TaxID=935616 RepID=A0ABV6NI22_9BACI|nr:glycosyltransferase [Halalkalibacter alkalisediminis]